MAMMLAMHTALRRELVRIRRIVERPGDDPRAVLHAAAGWDMFKTYLHVHHAAEDVALWPAMRPALEGGTDLALLDAMEAEHETIDPLLDAIDTTIANPDGETDRLAELVNRLSSALYDHLDHEEYDVLPLIDATITAQTWQAFIAEHGKRIGPDASRYFPWVFDGAQPAVVTSALAQLPRPLAEAFHAEWEPAYQRLGVWPRSAIDPLGAHTE